MPAPEFIDIVKDGVAAPARVPLAAASAYVNFYGWQLANPADAQYLSPLPPTPVVDVITRDELDLYASGISGSLAKADSALQLPSLYDVLAGYGALTPVTNREPVRNGTARHRSLRGGGGETYMATSPDETTSIEVGTQGAAFVYNILDNTNKGRPRVVASGTFTAAPGRPIAAGNGYFLVPLNGKVAGVDATTKTAPVVRESGTGARLGNAGLNRVATFDNNFFWVGQNTGSAITPIDWTTKTSAPVVGTALVDATNLGGPSDILAVSATRLLVACSNNNAAGNAVVTVAVNGINAPTYVTKLKDDTLLAQIAHLRPMPPNDIVGITAGGRAVSINAANPDALVLRASVASSTIQGTGSIARVGTMVYGSRRAAGLGAIYRVDFSDINNPVAPAASLTTDSFEWLGGLTASPYIAQTASGFSIAAGDLGQVTYYTDNPRTIPARTLFLELGDSLTQVGGTELQAQSTRGIVTYANLRNRRLHRAHNGGVAGQTIAQIAQRAYFDGRFYKPAITHLLAGTNSINLTTESAEVLFQQLLGIVKDALANQSLVIWGTIPPNSSTAAVPARQARLLALNALIRTAANTMPGVVLADYYAAAVADFNAGTPITAYFVDGTHWSPVGADAMAAQVLNPAIDVTLAGRQYGLGPELVGASVAFTGTGGTIGSGATGTAADGWTVSASAGSVAASKPTASVMRLDVPANSVVEATTTTTIADLDSRVGELLATVTTTGVVKRMWVSWQPTGGQVVYDLSPLYAQTPPVGGDDGATNPLPTYTAVPLTFQTPRSGSGSGVTTGALTVHIETLSGTATFDATTYRTPSALAS